MFHVSERLFILLITTALFVLSLFSCKKPASNTDSTQQAKAPNILFAIADDQSYPYASAYGVKTAQTPAFDRVASSGVLFNNAFCAAPQCSPSRAAILTGRNIWQLEEAGTHSSYFPKKFPVFTDALEANGYELGYTGKPWGPGNWKDAGWERNPVGPEYNEHKLDEVPYSGINKKNYSKNFEAFLNNKTDNKPFFFWYGCHEPHRVYEQGSGLKAGKKLTDAKVPGFLPDNEIGAGDVLDYAMEIEWFDKHLGEMIAMLEAKGELENTIIVITADNGMPFPYAKANLNEYGTHLPLAISGPGISGGRVVEDLVSLIDLAPTFLEMTHTSSFSGITGRSLKKLLEGDKTYEAREYVLTGRERHTHARPDNLGYPARAIRTQDYLYIHNFKPDLWPAGDPPVQLTKAEQENKKFKSMKEGYHDIDPSPSKTWMLENLSTGEMKSDPNVYFQLSMAKRPQEELYDIKNDSACLKNLASESEYAETLDMLRNKLVQKLTEQSDPRVLGTGDIFDSYPRFATMRAFPGFRERGKYNPKFQKK